MHPSTLRQDIQQLRAIAVLAVIANHLGATWLPGGYLGVDIFFVVSGFVITNSMLSGSMEATSRLQFFANFWIRRVFRLWPMLFITVLATCALILVTELGPKDTFITGIASLVGVANLRLLFGRLDYFALDTGSDWFMHTWSLAIEEQVYLVLSLVFFIFGGARIKASSSSLRVITAVMGVLVIASVYFSFASFTTDLVRFYSPHTRLYQIGAGALLSLVVARNTSGIPTRSAPIKLGLAYMGLASLLVQFITNFTDGATASLLSTLLTTIVLASGTPLQRSKGFVPVSWVGAIGDRSYALYLVHWPVQLFATSLIENKLNRALFSICLTFVIAIAGYKLIENPTRHLWRVIGTRRAIGLALVGLLVTVAITTIGYKYVGQKNKISAKTIPTESCSRENSSVWVIGDSHLGAIQHEIASALNGDCRVYGEIGFNVLFGTGVIELLPNGQTARGFKLRDIENLKSQIQINKPRIIVISHFLTGIVSAPETSPSSANWVAVEWRDEKVSQISRRLFLKQFGENLTDLVSIMADYGGLLVVTSPPPDFDWLSQPNDTYSDLNYEVLCSESFTSTTLEHIKPQCDIWRSEAVISREIHEARIGEIHNLLNTIETATKNFIHIALDEPFCDKSECRNFINGVPAYIDDDHLNSVGARMIAEKFSTLFGG